MRFIDVFLLIHSCQRMARVLITSSVDSLMASPRPQNFHNNLDRTTIFGA